MENLLSGAIGGIIATFLSAVIGYFIFKRQVTIDSNRLFIHDLLQVIQKVYISVQQNTSVDDTHINYIISFQAISLKEFDKLNNNLTELRSKILSYNDGVSKSLQMTSTSTLQVCTKSDVEKKIDEVVKELRKLT
jgi:hypothetical protein